MTSIVVGSHIVSLSLSKANAFIAIIMYTTKLYCVYTRAIKPGTVWHGTVRCGTRVFILFRAIPYSKGVERR